MNHINILPIILTFSLINIILSGIASMTYGASFNPTDLEVTDVFEGHTAPVTSVAWNPNGTWLASASSFKENKIIIWNVPTGSVIRTLIGHKDKITSIAWSPDGKRLVSSSWDSNITLWDAISGSQIKSIKGDEFRVNAIAWSPDGARIVSGGYNLNVIIWNSTTLTKIKTLAGHTEIVNSVDWSPDGKYIASVAMRQLKMWNGTSLEIMKNYKTNDHTNAVKWSPDGKRVAAGEEDNIWIYTIDTDDLLLIAPKTVDYLGEISSLAWSLNGSTIVTGSLSANIEFWNATTTEFIRPIWFNWSVNSISLSPDGSKLAAGMGDNKVRIIGKPESNVHLQSISVDKTNIYHNENLTITITLTNRGSKDSSAQTVILYDGNVILNTDQLDVTKKGCATSTFLWRTNEGTRLGSHLLRAVYGPEERNITVEIKGRPHVFLKTIEVNRSSIFIGDRINIAASIANDGTADSIDELLQLYDGNIILENRTLNISRNETLSVTIPWTALNISSIGLHTFRAVLKTVEKNTTVLVRGIPNVILSDIAVDRQQIVVGDDVFITSDLLNNGTADAMDVNVNFFFDDKLLTTLDTNVSQGGSSRVSYEWNTKITRPGTHTLTAVVGNSTLKKTIKIDERPTIFLGHPLSYWTTGFAIIIIIVFVVIIGYLLRKRIKRYH